MQSYTWGVAKETMPKGGHSGRAQGRTWKDSSGHLAGGRKRGRSAQRKALSKESKGHGGRMRGNGAKHTVEEVGEYKEVFGVRSSGKKTEKGAWRLLLWAVAMVYVIRWDTTLSKGAKEARMHTMVSDRQSRWFTDSARSWQLSTTSRDRVGVSRSNHNVGSVRFCRQQGAYVGTTGGIGVLGRLGSQCDSFRVKGTRCIGSAGGIGLGRLVHSELLGRSGDRVVGKAQRLRERHTMRHRERCTPKNGEVFMISLAKIRSLELGVLPWHYQRWGRWVTWRASGLGAGLSWEATLGAHRSTWMYSSQSRCNAGPSRLATQLEHGVARRYWQAPGFRAGLPWEDAGWERRSPRGDTSICKGRYWELPWVEWAPREGRWSMALDGYQGRARIWNILRKGAGEGCVHMVGNWHTGFECWLQRGGKAVGHSVHTGNRAGTSS